MILGNVLSSSPVQGVTVSASADDNPLLGYGAVGNGRQWVSTPGLGNAAINAMGTVTTAVNLDWSAYGYFTWTSTASSNETVTFYTTASNTAGTNLASYSLGQMIKIRITSSGATVATVTWPATVTWIGMQTGTSGSSVVAPVLVASKQTDITLICTATGSAPTFDGTYMTGT
jgi:hypothetical protein